MAPSKLSLQDSANHSTSIPGSNNDDWQAQMIQSDRELESIEIENQDQLERDLRAWAIIYS